MTSANAAQLVREGVAARDAGRAGEACRHFEEATLADPRNVEAWMLLGIALAGKGDQTRATAVFLRAAGLHPANPLVHFNLGLQLQGRGRHGEAIESFRRAIALHPGYSDAMSGLGSSLRKLGRGREAAAEFARAAALDPKWVDDLFGVGDELLSSRDYEGAIAALEQALAIRPGLVEARCQLGNALKESGRLGDAVAAYRGCLALNPDSAPLLNNLGIALQEQGLVEEAVAAFQRAIAVDPHYAEAYNSLAPALQRLNRLDEAIEACRRAIEIDPSQAAAHTNLGNAYLALNEVPRASEEFLRAVEISPSDWRFRSNLCYAYLASGRMREAWPLYEERFTANGHDFLRRLDRPRWRGETDIRGKTLFIHAEQGFGDTIQFARFAAVLARRGATVIVEVQTQLKALFASLEGASVVIGSGEAMPPYDLHCPMLSVPLALGTDLDSIPCPPPYVHADPVKTAYWAARFPRDPARLNVGLVWSGQPLHKNDHNRSMPAALLRGLAGNPGARFVCLQNEIRKPDREALASLPGIACVCPELKSFSDTAALVACMDLVVSVDTSVAHLAAAMGKPTWILLPFAADWRWMLTREDSPWYPTARLFRQPFVADWASVIDRVDAEITHLQGSR